MAAKIIKPKRRYRRVHKLCGGTVTLFTPPNPLFSPYDRCNKCGRPVIDYDAKRVLIRVSPSRNGHAKAEGKKTPDKPAPAKHPHICHDM